MVLIFISVIFIILDECAEVLPPYVDDCVAQFDSSVVLACVLFGRRPVMCKAWSMYKVMLMPSVLRKLESIPSRLNLKHWKAFSFVNNGTFLIEFSIRMHLLLVSNQHLWFTTNEDECNRAMCMLQEGEFLMKHVFHRARLKENLFLWRDSYVQRLKLWDLSL